MDSSKQLEPAKQLKHHLQLQQDPFSLHNYISERSYMFSKNTTHIHNSLHYSPKNLLRMSILRKRLSQAKGILRSVLHKFNMLTAGDGDDGEQYKITQQYEKNGVSSLMKRLADAASDNFTYSDDDDDDDVGDNKVLSYEHQDSTVINMFQTFTLPKLRRLERSVGDPMFSAFLRKILMTSDIVSMGHNLRNDKQHMDQTTPVYRRNKRILQKRKKKLLYNSVEKPKEFFQNSPINKAVSELEDLENVMHDHFWLLEKQYVEVRKHTHLLHTEPFNIASSQEWPNCSNINGEIHMEIGDAIMDDIILEIIDLISE
ncbi:uncharacterized protein G2W53_003014 [Senna tora]|uniref:DUF4378 domain-containing protein n=1 Tax=Senna tora TaxID=362788 RepID=A0A835CFC8_9FABA|nr:uncharacterized protein G2W53_003014 [Senna tora]